jgi:hypothetical protein
MSFAIDMSRFKPVFRARDFEASELITFRSVEFAVRAEFIGTRSSSYDIRFRIHG